MSCKGNVGKCAGILCDDFSICIVWILKQNFGVCEIYIYVYSYDIQGSVFNIEDPVELDPRLADFPVSRTRQYLLLTLKNEAEFLAFIVFRGLSFFCCKDLEGIYVCVCS